MSSLVDNINIAVKEAMRARDKNKLDALRLITAAIKQIEVDERIVVNDERMLVILTKMAKQRNESIHQFKLAGRTDLVDQEEFELGIINQYLPVQLTDDEVTHIVEETLVTLDAKQVSDMGKVMAHLKPILQGRADMGKVSAMLKTKLM
jgi:uncharacterized protein YqeY